MDSRFETAARDPTLGICNNKDHGCDPNDPNNLLRAKVLYKLRESPWIEASCLTLIKYLRLYLSNTYHDCEQLLTLCHTKGTPAYPHRHSHV